VQTLLRRRRVEPIVATILRASPVHRMGRFLARELWPPPGPECYRLRGSGDLVFVRHRTPDVAALGEVFYERQYEPPRRVADRLADRPDPLQIVDLGANVGFFSVFAMQRFAGAQVTAVEPDAANMHLLERTMNANGWRWKLVPAAATTADGEVRFAAGDFTSSRIDPAGEVVPAVDAFPILKGADLAKIDIEGGEWEILADGRLAAASIVAIVVEYHPYLCPGPNPRSYATGCLLVAGYEVERGIEFGGGQGMLWAWR
jgi:FkbM family methyltransferase